MKLRDLSLLLAFVAGMIFAFMITLIATSSYYEAIIKFYKNGYQEPPKTDAYELSGDISDLGIPRGGVLRTIQHNDILFQAVSRSISEDDRDQR